jgi:hypothetical protein
VLGFLADLFFSGDIKPPGILDPQAGQGASWHQAGDKLTAIDSGKCFVTLHVILLFYIRFIIGKRSGSPPYNHTKISLQSLIVVADILLADAGEDQTHSRKNMRRSETAAFLFIRVDYLQFDSGTGKQHSMSG